jgi:hypothetical protein
VAGERVVRVGCGLRGTSWRGDRHGQRGEHVGEQVDQQQLAGAQRRAAAERRAQHRERDLAGVPADQHGHRVADPRPHRAALRDGVDQVGEVGVGEHEVRRAARGGRLGSPGAADAHAHVGEPDSGGVVDPVAGHRQRRAGPAQRPHQRHLLLR